METKLNYLQGIVSERWNTRDGSVCLEGVTPIAPVRVLENQLFQSEQGCFQITCAYKIVYAFSLFALIGSILQKVKPRSVSNAYIITPAWPDQ